ncbi:Endoplasmic reticulum metallopeptidase 1 [Nymphaea thermarum]|nr:Endoplasmic reticulum metallopeptidase 1 [Nymphaea thermarum]
MILVVLLVILFECALFLGGLASNARRATTSASPSRRSPVPAFSSSGSRNHNSSFPVTVFFVFLRSNSRSQFYGALQLKLYLQKPQISRSRIAIGVRMKAGDATAVKLLLALGFMFSMMAALAYCIHNMKHVRPLPMDAPLDRFSEARAVEHVRHLSKEIQGRQEGSPGLLQAAHYIKARLEAIAARAGSNYSIEIDESVVDGSFSMNFLGHSITFGYRKHTNIAMRIASEYSKDTDPTVLVNAHFDGPLGSPGAGDCASCVASLLELARLIVDSSWIPPQPIIFLFNGAEELFLLGSHGFTKTHKWRDSVGAFINIEASGTGGFGIDFLHM